MWLECIGVVNGCCCKKVYRYSHNNYYFSLLHLYYIALFCSSIPLSLFILKMFFRSLRIRTPNGDFFTSCGTHINCIIMAMLYTH